MDLALNNLRMLTCQMLTTNQLPLWVRVELGVMAMKEYSAFPKVPEL